MNVGFVSHTGFGELWLLPSTGTFAIINDTGLEEFHHEKFGLYQPLVLIDFGFISHTDLGEL
jgi:hypothetical protein